ncbi:DgyrCDS9389 [Dimorphilus gyrociliatus]|uniref:DgyrCDS9389 n=1 Tax=Dimorphilus gyrociliatus TaxID=2664684 RepID=A0A7I8VZ16_9ANNE|nr:DgyrCDS9389 [Dimorphilus gyrociliatus]
MVQEEQFEQLTRELEAERQSVAQQIEKCKLGSETASMNSISETDESYPWRAPTHTSHTSTSGHITNQLPPPIAEEESDADSKLSGTQLVDSYLRVLHEKGLLNEYTRNRQPPVMNDGSNPYHGLDQKASRDYDQSGQLSSHYSAGEDDSYLGSPYGQPDHQRLAAAYNDNGREHIAEDSRRYDPEDSRRYESEDNRRYAGDDSRRYEVDDGRRYETDDGRRFEVDDGRRYETDDGRRYEANDSVRYEVDEGRRYDDEEGRRFESEESRRYDVDDRRYNTDDRRYDAENARRYNTEDNAYGRNNKYYSQDVDDKYGQYTMQDRQQVYPEEDERLRHEAYRGGLENQSKNMHYNEDARNGSYDERLPAYGYDSSIDRAQAVAVSNYYKSEYEGEESPYGTRGVNGHDRYEVEDEYPTGAKLSETYPEENNYSLSARDAHLKRVQPERDVYLASGGSGGGGEPLPNNWAEPEYNSQNSHWSSNTPNRSAPNFPAGEDSRLDRSEEETPPKEGYPNESWRNPDLSEVINFLRYPSDVIKANAAAYLQHLTFNDDDMKGKTRSLGGIKALVELANSNTNDLVRAACGALRNLCYGRKHDENKREIKKYGGLSVMDKILQRIDDVDIREMVTGILWNMSSCDEIKRPIIDEVLQTLVDEIIVPHSPDNNNGHYSQVSWTTVFRNASGTLRNISSDGIYARTRLRECDNLIISLINILGAAVGLNDIDNKNVENCVCILRNLSFACQEVVDPEYNRRKKQAPQAPSSPTATGCFGSKKKTNNNNSNNRPPPNIPVTGVKGSVQLLWHPTTLRTLLNMIKECTNPATLEAGVGVIQNLAACQWSISVEYRTLVRYERGMSDIYELFDVQSDEVIRTAASALRNLSFDTKNRDLVAIHAMLRLIMKLPPWQTSQSMPISSDTIATILATLYEITKDHSAFSRQFLEKGGMSKVEHLAKSPKYSAKVNKYALCLWNQLWKLKELHMDYKMAGFKENSVNQSGGSKTSNRSAPEMSTKSLQRPIMDQSSHGTTNTMPLVQRGPPPTTITQQERFHAQDMRSPSPYDTVDRNYRPMGAVPMFPGLDEPDSVVSREPVYAQVRSQSQYPNGAPSNNADSWV